MAAARNCRPTTLPVAATLILIATLTFPPHISVGDDSSSSSSSTTSSRVLEEIRKKGVLGSRPPGCLNKCMNCSPCEPTLVIPPHPFIIGSKGYNHQSSHPDDDSYYLLSWKCTCGDKLFQP